MKNFLKLSTVWGVTSLLGTTALLLAQTPQTARADGTTYSSTKKQYKVGILLIDSSADEDLNGVISPAEAARGPENPDPFVFYISDISKLKPAGWDIVNPLAPSTITTDIYQRWSAANGRDPSNPYQLGQKVTKNMAAYWEVSLNQSSVSDLLKYDLLFITNHRTERFTSAEREKMRKLVDAGGVIWIEDCGNMRIDTNEPFFLQDLQFTNTGTGTGGPSINIPSHPILNTPYQLSTVEIANLGDKNYANFAMTSISNPGQAPNPETLLNIVGNRGANGLPYIAAGNYGSGAVIATSSDSGCDINDYAGGSNSGSGGNSGAFCGPNTDTAHAEDLKFVYNVISWGGANNSFRRNNRRTASALDTVGAPLVTGFDFQNSGSVYGRPGDIVDSKSAPLIIKGIVFVSGVSNGTPTLRAYDANPYRDLDGDGNPDEGLPDLSLGLSYDEIWRASAGGVGDVQPSTPIYATFSVRGSGGLGTTPYERIYVTLPNGGLAIYNAFPVDGNGRLAANNTPLIIAPEGGGSYNSDINGGVAPAPVFLENRIYQVEPSGLLRCIDAATGTTLWKTFTNVPTDRQIQPAATPTVGYIRQVLSTTFAQASGGNTNDLMLYMPVREVRMNGNTPALMYPYWLGTRNEVQTWANGPDGENGLVNTRIAGGPGGPAKDQYFMAAGTYADPAYITPKPRVFAAKYDRSTTPPTVLISAKENLANGVESPDYQGTVVDEKGQIKITKIGSSGEPEPTRGNVPDLLVSIDYDVVYIAGSTAPAAYDDIGARGNGRLGFGGTYAGGLGTPALSPDDILIYGVDQAHHKTDPSTQAVTRDTQRAAGIFAATEQEGQTGALVRWHMLMFGDGPDSAYTRVTQDSPKTATYPANLAYIQQALIRDVDNQQVVDLAPLRNYLVFDNAWPGIAGGSQNAEKIQTTVTTASGTALSDDYETLANVRVVGTPIVTNDGLTYVLANAYSLANSGGLTAIPQTNNDNDISNVNVLMAFKTNPEIVLHTQQPFDGARGVQVTQADALSDPANPATIGNSAVAINGNGNGAQFSLDGDRSTIVVNNFAAGNRQFSATQSFVVRYTPLNTNTPVTEIITPTPSGTTSGTTANANPGGFTPLQWYYVLPGRAQSSPTLVGENIYFTIKKGGNNYLIAVDADPASQDPSVRIGFGDPVQNVVANLTVGTTTGPTDTNHVRMASLVGSPNASLVAPPVGVDNTLVLNSSVPNGGTIPLGTFAFQNGLTLISQNNGLVEARPDGSVTWKMDTTVAQTTVGGKLVSFNQAGQPYDPSASGAVSVARVPLAHPTAVRKISESDFLIADTGSNRAVRVDRAGNVLWNLATLSDPYGILASGDATTLSGPTDVQYYTVPTLTGGSVTGYSIHYLVADAGNFRIIEVADFYDANGAPAAAPGTTGTEGLHVVVWTTRTSALQSRQLRFQSIQRKIGVAPQGSANAGAFGFPYLVAVVGNTAVSGGASTPSADASGGALVTLNYSPYNTPIFLRDATSGAVVATPTYWQGGADARATEPLNNGLLVSSRDDLTINQNGTLVKKRIGRPTYFQQLTLPNASGAGIRTVYLLCDGDGVYAVENQGGTLLVRWMFTQDDYNLMNGVNTFGANKNNGVIVANTNNTRLAFDALGVYSAGQTLGQYTDQLPQFSPTSVKLLPSGNFLISNSYAGRSSLFDGGRFVGEVFEVKPNGVAVTVPGITTTERGGSFDLFAVPALNKISIRSTTNGVLLHVNRQVMGNPTGNTALLEQPVYSDRP